VLHRALTRPREDRARDAVSSPAEHTAAQRLIAAGLLEDDPGVLRPTPRPRRRSGHPRTAAISADPTIRPARWPYRRAARCMTKRCQRADQTAVTEVSSHNCDSKPVGPFAGSAIPS
jgi:hypothetical protein